MGSAHCPVCCPPEKVVVETPGGFHSFPATSTWHTDNAACLHVVDGGTEVALFREWSSVSVKAVQS